MRLLITTPTSVVVDQRDVVAVRAEDESGSFILRQSQPPLLLHRRAGLCRHWRLGVSRGA